MLKWAKENIENFIDDVVDKFGPGIMMVLHGGSGFSMALLKSKLYKYIKSSPELDDMEAKDLDFSILAVDGNTKKAEAILNACLKDLTDELHNKIADDGAGFLEDLHDWLNKRGVKCGSVEFMNTNHLTVYKDKLCMDMHQGPGKCSKDSVKRLANSDIERKKQAKDTCYPLNRTSNNLEFDTSFGTRLLKNAFTLVRLRVGVRIDGHKTQAPFLDFAITNKKDFKYSDMSAKDVFDKTQSSTVVDEGRDDVSPFLPHVSNVLRYPKPAYLVETLIRQLVNYMDRLEGAKKTGFKEHRPTLEDKCDKLARRLYITIVMHQLETSGTRGLKELQMVDTDALEETIIFFLERSDMYNKTVLNAIAQTLVRILSGGPSQFSATLTATSYLDMAKKMAGNILKNVERNASLISNKPQSALAMTTYRPTGMVGAGPTKKKPVSAKKKPASAKKKPVSANKKK